MDEDELSNLTVAALKKRLKEEGLSTTGKKADLISRLLDSRDEGDLILDDDDDDVILDPEPASIDDEEILEAEVFEAEIIEAEDTEQIEKGQQDAVARLSTENVLVSKPWFKDGTTIATILVVLILAGAGGWWYFNESATVYQIDPSRYGDDLQFTVSDGQLKAEGDEMVEYVRDTMGEALDQVCGRLQIDFQGTGSSSITDGELTDLKDPGDSKLKGAVMANGPYGRTWNTVESNLEYDLSADLSGYTWSAINPDSCSTNTAWSANNNQLDVEVKRWTEITEQDLLRSDSKIQFTDSEGQESSIEASTFGNIIGSDTFSDLVGEILLPMHPVDLYDIFGVTILEEGATHTQPYQGWGWQIGSTSTIGGQDAIQVRMHHIEIGKCLGRAEMVLWAIPGQPLPAKQVVDVMIDKSMQTSSCSFTLSEAIDLVYPDGTLVAKYTLEQTAFKRGSDLLDWKETYATRPMPGEGVPSEEDREIWATHMWDNSTERSFTLEKAVTCVTTDADAFGPAHTALNSDGYIFAAKDDRTGMDPVWNLSWISSAEAGWVRVTWPGGENCFNSGDGQISGEDKPEHARERIPSTHRLALLETRMTSENYYPDLSGLVASNGQLRNDVNVGYTLLVPDDNAVSDWLDDFDILDGRVTVYLERSWTSENIEYTLQAGMDGETGRMAGWIITATSA
ncbi:MAG: SAP domain-containing protein [Candidatus Thermoplasmatota archaeon]|nr:SAP domain-containing protein [Candidatus Thermoplasmatota archaeon]